MTTSIEYEPDSGDGSDASIHSDDKDYHKTTVGKKSSPVLEHVKPLEKQTRKERMDLLVKQISQNKRKHEESESEVSDSDVDNESNDSEEKEWEVEKIVAKKIRHGVPFYKIRWTGYTSDDDTWEPAEHLPKELIDEYENNLENTLIKWNENRTKKQKISQFVTKSQPKTTTVNSSKVFEKPLQKQLEEKDEDYKTSENITQKDLAMMGNSPEKWLNGPLYIMLNNKQYGHIGKLFQTFKDRNECSKAGIMKPTRNGISGRGDVPADAVVCNGTGGYKDIDYGDVLIYCGQGGGINQDQTLTEYNRALYTNMQDKVPVRVVRSANMESKWSPTYPYRYDGIYFVTAVFSERLMGDTGPKFYRFRLVRCPGQAAIPTRTNFVPSLQISDKMQLFERQSYLDKLKSSKLNKAQKSVSKFRKLKDDMAKEGKKHVLSTHVGVMTIPSAALLQQSKM